MNREIKFRGWDSIHNMWITKGIAINLDGTVYDKDLECPDDNLIIQQYTGYKDFKNKEIYEGTFYMLFTVKDTNEIVHMIGTEISK